MKKAIELQTSLVSCLEELLSAAEDHCATAEGAKAILSEEMDRAIENGDLSDLRRYIEEARENSERIGYSSGVARSVKIINHAIVSFFEENKSN